MRFLIKSITFVTLALSATVFAAEDEGKANPLPLLPSPEGAKVHFTNIEDGTVVSETFTVTFEVVGMDVRKAGEDAKNSGHHHILINAEEMPAMNLPLPKSDTVRHFGGAETQAELSLPPGEHTLQLLFADYRHIPHDPPVMSEKITVVVE